MRWKSCVMVIAGAVALASCTGKNGSERTDTAARDAGYIGKYLYMYDGRFRTDVSFNMNNFEL